MKEIKRPSEGKGLGAEPSASQDARKSRVSVFWDITRGSAAESNEPFEVEEEEKASLLSSMINLANTVMGTGVLALPAAVASAGFVLGMLFLVGGACLAGLSLYLLGQSAIHLGGPQSFTTMGDKVKGGLSILVEACVILNCLGAAIGYLIVASTSFTASFGGSRQIWVVVGTCLAAPLALLKTMDSLRITSAIAVIILILLGLMVILFFAEPADSLSPCGSVGNETCRGDIDAFGEALPTISAFVVFTNAFTCQQSLLPIMSEMADPSPARLKLLIGAALATVLPLYLVFSIFGYLEFGDNVESDILQSYPNNGFTTAARIGIAFVVISSYPVQAIANIYLKSRELCCAGKAEEPTPMAEPMVTGKRSSMGRTSMGHRSSLASLTEGSKLLAGGPTWTNQRETPELGAGWCARCKTLLIDDKLELLVVVCITAVSFGVAMAVTDLGIIVSITGATGAASITFIFPGLFYAYLKRDDGMTCLRVSAIGLFCFGLIIIPLSLTLTFIGY